MTASAPRGRSTSPWVASHWVKRRSVSASGAAASTSFCEIDVKLRQKRVSSGCSVGLPRPQVVGGGARRDDTLSCMGS